MLHLAEWAHKKEVEKDGTLDRLQGSLIEGSPLSDTTLHASSSSSDSASSYDADGQIVLATERAKEPLNHFWRRYNQSLLGKVAFQEQRDALVEENRMLQVRTEGGGRLNDTTALDLSHLLIITIVCVCSH